MYYIGDKVKGCIEEITRIGTIDGININPGTKVVSYMVFFPFLKDCIELFEDELTLYTHEHISNAFSRKTNETRQFDSGND